MSITTKTGDKGFTSILTGQRVPKYDLRPQTYGTIDEANSALGAARAVCSHHRIKEVIFSIQQELFLIGGELACEPPDYSHLKTRITQEQVERLENLIVEYEGAITIAPSFVIPGSTFSSSLLDMARTIVRRAERGAVELTAKGSLQNDFLLKYLNRLSDLLWIFARYVEQHQDEV